MSASPLLRPAMPVLLFGWVVGAAGIATAADAPKSDTPKSDTPKSDGPSPAAPAEPADLKPLFNGKDLDGWDGDTRLWSVQEGGVIRGQTTKENVAKGNTFLIWKGGTPADFELRLSFRIAGGNSGVQYRSKQVPAKETDQNRWVVGGYQAEVENTAGKVGFLYHERGRGYLCNVGDKVEIGEDGKPKVVGKLGDKAAIGATYKKGDWNDYVIIAKGNRVQHWLNGWQTVDMTDNDPKGRCLSGVIALQIHAGPPMTVEFKSVRIKVHADAPAAAAPAPAAK